MLHKLEKISHAESPKIVKKIFLLLFICISALSAQFDLYPVEDFFGGGIGYSPMYISMDSIPAKTNLEGLGLDTRGFDNPFVLHGGEGFAHMTGKWRIGGYAGVGSSKISTVPNVYIYDATSGIAGAVVNTDPLFVPSIEGKITISLGAATVEHVMPVFQDLEIAAGALLGLCRISVSVDQRTGTAVWDNTFTSAYGTVDSVDTDGDGINDILAWIYKVEDIGTTGVPSPTEVEPIPGVLSDVSGTFFNFQPYVAIKWQLLDRVGLRISVGFNKGTIRQGRWILNGRTQVADSQPFSLQGVAFRTMLYLGL